MHYPQITEQNQGVHQGHKPQCCRKQKTSTRPPVACIQCIVLAVKPLTQSAVPMPLVTCTHISSRVQRSWVQKWLSNQICLSSRCFSSRQYWHGFCMWVGVKVEWNKFAQRQKPTATSQQAASACSIDVYMYYTLNQCVWKFGNT